MKFVHVNDIRLGSSAEAGTRWGEARRDELFASLRRVLEWADGSGTELLLVSGGLFAHQPVTAELEQVSALFREYPKIETVIIAGETDRVKKFSPIRSFLWPKHVHYVLSGDAEQIDLPGLHTAVYAASRTDGAPPEPGAILLAELKGLMGDNANGAGPGAEEIRRMAEAAEPIRIAMLRCETDGKIRESFSDSGFSYVAVGQSGGRKCLIENMAYCPGSLEPEQMQDSGAHGIYAGETGPEGRLLKIEFIPLSEVAYVPLKAEVHPGITREELEKSLQKEIEGRGGRNIYRLKLYGTRSPEEQFDLEGLKERYRIAEVIDETEPVYDFTALFEEHPQDMIGFYIGSIARGRKDMSPLEKKAMYYGIDALIRTSEGEEQ